MDTLASKPLDSSSAPDPEQAPAAGIWSGRPVAWIMGILLTYFACRLVFYAVTISAYVPPDEVTHLGLSRIFSRVLFLPENAPDTYRYGLVTNVPWLYYWIMGKLIHLNIFRLPDLLFLRLCNIPLAFGTVYFAWRTLRLITSDRLPQILLVATLTNISMFSFLSASISYDNLTNLLAAMAIFYFLSFIRDRSADSLLVSLTCQLAGCITKKVFLPLFLVLNVSLLVLEFRNLRDFWPAAVVYLRTGTWRSRALIAAAALCLMLNLHLYGGNFLHYRSLAPEMSTVLSPEIALQNRIAARDLIFTLFKEERISFDQAFEMTSLIDHPGDRADAVYLLENYVKHMQSGAALLSPLSYALPWVRQMLSGILGIKGHLFMFSYWLTNISVVILMALTAVAIILRWRPRREELLPSLLGIIAGFYSLFLMFAVNYKIYVYYASFPLAVHGRYLFPVIGPLGVLFCWYLLRLFTGSTARLCLTAAVVLLFVASDFPFFLTHVTPEWFSSALKQ